MHLSLNIIGNKQLIVNNKSKTHYVLEISHLKDEIKKTWTLDKTYEDFEKIYQILQKNHPNCNLKQKFPVKNFLSIKSSESIFQRQYDLNNFLKDLLTKPVLLEDFNFAKFIGLIENTNGFVKKMIFVDKFICYNKKAYFLILNENLICSIFSSSKNIIGNNQLLSKKNLSLVKFFTFNNGWLGKNDNSDLEFEKSISSKSLNGNILILGFENGNITIIKLLKESIEFLVKDLKIHNSKIIGSYLYKDSIITVSSKTIKITSIVTNKKINENKLDYEISSTYFINDECVLFLGTSCGKLLAVNLSSNAFILLSKIKLDVKGKIKCMDFENNTVYLGLNTGYYIVINVGFESRKSIYSNNVEVDKNQNNTNKMNKKVFYLLVDRIIKTGFEVRKYYY